MSTLTTVQRVVVSCQQLVECIIDNVSEVILKAGVRSNEVDKTLRQHRNPFVSVDTEYTQTSYMKSLGVYVSPETYVIGNRQTFVTDKVLNVKKPVMECASGQYISVGKMIQAINSKTTLITDSLKVNAQARDDGVYRSFFDVSLWKQHPLKDEPVIVLRLNGDYFQPCNSLGSRKTIYKLGWIYYQFENLPSKLLSRTEKAVHEMLHKTDVAVFLTYYQVWEDQGKMMLV